MPRPQRCRRIGCFPDRWRFGPLDEEPGEAVTLTLDEFETIRLMDREGLTQEQCAGRMGVARTTVTAIYESARRKVAALIVDGAALRIAGGSYALAENENENIYPKKGNNQMRIAIPYDNGEIFQHFGHTEQFKVYDVTDGQIVLTAVVNAAGHGHGALAGFLKMGGVDAVICGGIGGGARNALAEAGIRLCPGVTGSADEAAAALAAGTLQYDADAQCDHHGEGHGEGGHCGHHGEGHGEGGHCGRHGEGHGEGHCGRHGEGHGEGHCGRHGEGHGEGHCGRHGEGRGEDKDCCADEPKE